jgi:2-oxoacid:acceptor oxidoreductase delta subunit (pyruvate/2-ketoisovalerate family)
MTFIPDPKKYDDLPAGPSFEGKHPTMPTANWRIFRPVLDQEKCNNCLLCWIFCPEGVITRSGNTVEITYEFCKGCGICANECHPGAIEMVREE